VQEANLKTIRIGSGSGFWGDWQQAPINLVRQGPIDYLVLDYLAELTMSVLAKQQQKSPEHGYVKDFVDLILEIAPDLSAKGIKVLANAGGVNPHACGRALKDKLSNLQLSKPLNIYVVSGDNITSRLDHLMQAGETLSNMDTGQDLNLNQVSPVSANAYLGASPMVRALQAGADIIITGRVGDAALALAPMIYEFSWAYDDWNHLALGTVAGHLVECGAQVTGGNFSADWQSVPDLANIGYPIIEIDAAGECIITKHPGTGGLVNLQTIKEQLVYEIGDPVTYITPDVVADFTSVQLRDLGNNRVQISNVKGKAATKFYKVSICYENGFRAENSLIYSAPNAQSKAQLSAEIFKERISALNLDAIRVELVGLNACHDNLLPQVGYEPEEILLRVAARSQSEKELRKFNRELTPLVLSGPPSVSGYTSGGKITQIFSFWPALVSKLKVDSSVTVERV
jgi:hypothetical protein